jgi:transposase
MATQGVAADQKKAKRQQAVVVFLDESGFLLQPVRRRTWALRGQTPIPYAWDRHDRLSAVAALTFSPKTRRPGVFFRLLDHSLRTPDGLDFLTDLHRHVRRKMIVVWDRLNVHRSAARQFAERHPDGFDFEWLPAYAPDLNPVEQLWNHTKYSELANVIPENVEELYDIVEITIDANRQNRYLLNSFLDYTALAF